MKATAGALLPGGKGPAFAVGHPTVLLHGDVALVTDAATEEGTAIPLAGLWSRPERGMREPGIPEGAVGESVRLVEGKKCVQRLSCLGMPRNTEAGLISS